MSLEALLLGGIGLVFLLIMASFMATFFRRCPPNQAMIVSGMLAAEERGPFPFKVVMEGGTVVVPVLQQVSYLSLEVRKLKLHAAISSADDLPLEIDAVAFVKVRNDEIGISLAATQLLSKSADEVAEICTAILTPRLQDVVRAGDAKSLLDSFSDTGRKVLEQAEPELTAMGMSCVAFTIESIVEQSGQRLSQTAKSTSNSQIL